MDIKSNVLTRSFANRPFLVFVIQMMLFLLAIAVAMGFKMYELTMRNSRDFLNWDDIMTVRFDELEAAEEAL